MPCHSPLPPRAFRQRVPALLADIFSTKATKANGGVPKGRRLRSPDQLLPASQLVRIYHLPQITQVSDRSQVKRQLREAEGARSLCSGRAVARVR